MFNEQNYFLFRFQGHATLHPTTQEPNGDSLGKPIHTKPTDIWLRQHLSGVTMNIAVGEAESSISAVQ